MHGCRVRPGDRAARDPLEDRARRDHGSGSRRSSEREYLSKSVAYQYAIANLNKNSNTLSSLTNREYQVFTLLAQGRSINEIAGDLFISSKTVHVYRANIMSKLQLDSAFELTLMAIKNGIISVDAID